MATSVTFDYGGLYGPVTESDKTEADITSFSYGSLYGAVVGIKTADAPPPTLTGMSTITGISTLTFA